MVGAARLEVLTGKAAGMSILIDDELVIGRVTEGAGRLIDDEEISRSHARLSMDSSGRCTIEDLGSTNGTWVNGMRITTPQTLSQGDTVELGGTTMTVREVPEVKTPFSEPAPTGAPAHETEISALPPPYSPEALVAPGAPAADIAPRPSAREVALEPLDSEALAAAPEPAGVASSTMSMHLDIDFGGREVRIHVDDAAEPITLAFDGNSWRPASSPSIEKGNPA
jgi:predicted component of type VI protein secretion system